MMNWNNKINPVEYLSITGVVLAVYPHTENCCYQMIEISTPEAGIANLIAGPDTYFVRQARIIPGMQVVGFYDGNAPMPLIYPPQYNALVIGEVTSWQNIKVDFFDRNLVSSDGTLRLNISDSTDIITKTGQDFLCGVSDRTLIVLYGASTRSIPAQTTPDQIIVLC